MVSFLIWHMLETQKINFIDKVLEAKNVTQTIILDSYFKAQWNVDFLPYLVIHERFSTLSILDRWTIKVVYVRKLGVHRKINLI